MIEEKGRGGAPAAGDSARSKVGFSLGGTKAKSKVKASLRGEPGQDEIRRSHKEFITAVANGEIESAEGARKGDADQTKVIPCLADTWQGAAASISGDGHKKYVPSAAAELKEELERNRSGDTEDRFVKEEENPDVEGANEVTYGLQKRAAPAAAKQSKELSIPLRDLEEARLKEDVRTLPAESNLEAYEAMPIEDFGKAMLFGMGWKEGQPAGRNAKNEVLPVEIVPWKNRMGLGASEEAAEEIAATRKDRKGFGSNQRKVCVSGLKRARPGDFTEQREKAKEAEEAASKGPTRRVGASQPVSSFSNGKPKVGAHVAIRDGIHKNLKGRVVEISDNGVATVRLSVNNEKVKIKVGHLSDPNSEMRAPDPSSESTSKAAGSKPRSESGPTWLVPSIRVRVISKSFENGRYYLKKGYIVDVPTPNHADIMIQGADNSESAKLIRGMARSRLETVVPKPGGRILIVRGKYMGERGKLLEKNSKQGWAQVQLQESFKIVSTDMDNVAEYVGAMDDYD